jgi:hypothetical protein
MKLLISSTLFLFSLAVFGQTPQPPTPAKTTVVTPKETNASLKLSLNRSQYSSVILQYQAQEQQEYYNKIKPVLDGLDAQEQDFIKQVRADNNWDDSYTFDNKTGQWEKTEKK